MSKKDPQSELTTGRKEINPTEITVELSDSVLRKAEELATSDGISLEDFILYALAEKIVRSETPE